MSKNEEIIPEDKENSLKEMWGRKRERERGRERGREETVVAQNVKDMKRKKKWNKCRVPDCEWINERGRERKGCCWIFYARETSMK